MIKGFRLFKIKENKTVLNYDLMDTITIHDADRYIDKLFQDFPELQDEVEAYGVDDYNYYFKVWFTYDGVHFYIDISKDVVKHNTDKIYYKRRIKDQIVRIKNLIDNPIEIVEWDVDDVYVSNMCRTEHIKGVVRYHENIGSNELAKYVADKFHDFIEDIHFYDFGDFDNETENDACRFELTRIIL